LEALNNAGFILTEESLSRVLLYMVSADLLNDAEKDEWNIYTLTNKGLLLFVSGGLTKKRDIKQAKEKLFRWGQWATITAGVYYAIEILKNLLKM
jgi:hypothetical protein